MDKRNSNFKFPRGVKDDLKKLSSDSGHSMTSILLVSLWKFTLLSPRAQEKAVRDWRRKYA